MGGKTAISALLVWLAACPSATAQEDQARHGRKVALKACARCHVVDDGAPFTGISSTPSFSLMVNALKDWETRFLSFHTRLPHPSAIRFAGETEDPENPLRMAPVDLEYSDIEAIAAFARTLKKKN